MQRLDLSFNSHCLDRMELPLSVAEYSAMINPFLEAGFKDAALLPGAARLVNHFSKIGVPMAIATGSCEPSYKQKIERHMLTIVCFRIHLKYSI